MMLQKKILAFGFIALGFLVWISFANFDSERMAAEPALADDARSTEAGDDSKIHVSQPQSTSTAAKEKPAEQAELVTYEPINDEADFLESIAAADILSSSGVHLIVASLRASDANKMGEYFQSALKNAGIGDNRDRLLQLGNAWQGEELLGFWRDLALRRVPRFADEAKLKHSVEPTIAQHSINMELAMSIRNLGLIAFKREEALDALQIIITKPIDQIHDAVMRERAFEAIREVDSSLAVRIFKSLAQNDELRASIIAKRKALSK